MEMYYEKGLSRMDCELRIAEKYNRPFHVFSQKEIKIGGFMGFFSKPGVEVGFYFSPTLSKSPSWGNRIYETANPASLEEEKRKVIAAAGKSYEQSLANTGTSNNDIVNTGIVNTGIVNTRDAAQQILNSLNEIKDKINSGGREEHPAFARAAELLKINDFSEKYTAGILERLRKEMPFETLDDPDAVQEKMLEWIGESISIYKEDEVMRKPRIMVLVGPTGVGKTTTISKLAAIYGIGTDEIPAIEVRMITIDAFRICAKEQLESIGNIMQIPVSSADSKMTLRKEIALHSEYVDLFLVDTIGKSPKDAAKLGEMKEILDGCGRSADYHLVLSAGTKTSDIEDILRQFEPFNYKSVILTKLDETDRIGNIISALAAKKKSISYITDGQTVPVDIRKASVVRFLINLEGFKVDREKIETRFPSGEADNFKWR
ncbi:MAG: flagellar biosynthesis protein FlhF [Treponema sp.]|jgi:flagellar biosynthesis protein FlhF|nr:flagellar biosynthesis protein FlhF [Treponema sp.]